MTDERIPFSALEECDCFMQSKNEMRARLIGVADGTVEPEAVINDIRFTAKEEGLPCWQIVYAVARETITRHAETGQIDVRLKVAIVSMCRAAAGFMRKYSPGGLVESFRQTGLERYADAALTFQNASRSLHRQADNFMTLADDIEAAADADAIVRRLEQVRLLKCQPFP